VHPLDGTGEPARQRVPADPAAVAGQLDAGWVLPNKDGTVPKRVRAKAEKASSTQSPAPERGSRTSGPSHPEQSTSGPADSTATDTKEE
jgi:hypothetical protein